MRGGLGCAVVEGAGFVTAAVMAVNAVGDVRDGETGRLVAGARDAGAGERLVDTARRRWPRARHRPCSVPQNTTIGCVVTDARLGKARGRPVAALAMDGCAQALVAAASGHRRRHALLSLDRRPRRGSRPGGARRRARWRQAILRGVRAATGCRGCRRRATSTLTHGRIPSRPVRSHRPPAVPRRDLPDASPISPLVVYTPLRAPLALNARIGILLPEVAAWYLIIAHGLGGIMLVLGSDAAGPPWLTCWWMLGALFFVHLHQGYFINGGARGQRAAAGVATSDALSWWGDVAQALLGGGAGGHPAG